jgi:tetratricopeptide (TPR) repeat protein
MKSAEDAFRKASLYLNRSSSGNAKIRAEIALMQASLRRAQRRFPEALAQVETALALHRDAKDVPGIGAALLAQAKLLADAGDLDTAIAILEECAEEINPAAEPRLFAYLRYNLVGCLVLANRCEEAARVVPEVRALLEAVGQTLDLVRLRWAEGNVFLGLGQPGPAEAAFRKVRQEFLDRGMGYDAALVSLDLAQLYAQESLHGELKRLAAELMPIFASRDVHREALVALFFFQKACEEERLTVTLAREIAAHLRRERVSPG